MKRNLALLLAFFALFLQTGCITLLPDSGPAPKQLFLNPNTTAVLQDHVSGSASKSIAVAKPTAPTHYETNRLSVRYLTKGSSKVGAGLPVTDHISGITVQDALPDLVQHHLVKALMESQKFKAAGMVRESFKRDYILEVYIDSFDIVIDQSDMNASMNAVVSMTVKLLKSKGRDVIWQKHFVGTDPINTHSTKAFLDGLKQAYEQVLKEIVIFIN